MVFPQIRQQLTNKIKKDHQQAIEEIQGQHQQAIREKDAAIALLNDDLQGCDNQNKPSSTIMWHCKYKEMCIRTSYKNIITHLKTRHVPHAKDPGKENIVMIIEKNTSPEEDEFYDYPYYIARIQRWFITTQKKTMV